VLTALTITDGAPNKPGSGVEPARFVSFILIAWPQCKFIVTMMLGTVAGPSQFSEGLPMQD